MTNRSGYDRRNGCGQGGRFGGCGGDYSYNKPSLNSTDDGIDGWGRSRKVNDENSGPNWRRNAGANGGSDSKWAKCTGKSGWDDY